MITKYANVCVCDVTHLCHTALYYLFIVMSAYICPTVLNSLHNNESGERGAKWEIYFIFADSQFKIQGLRRESDIMTKIHIERKREREREEKKTNR